MKRIQKTYHAKPLEVGQQWVIIDAKDQVLGRLAAKVATIIRGKDRPTYTPSVDTGRFVVVINAEQIRVTGNKETDKMYYHHSGHPGGLKEENYAQIMRKNPRRIVEEAVKGMLPHNRLGRRLFTKLKVYVGESHPHEAQNPEVITV